MKNMGKIMKAAHKMAKEIVAKFGDVDYAAQLGLCISYVLENGDGEMEEKKEKEELVIKDVFRGKNLKPVVITNKYVFVVPNSKYVERIIRVTEEFEDEQKDYKEWGLDIPTLDEYLEEVGLLELTTSKAPERYCDYEKKWK